MVVFGSNFLLICVSCWFLVGFLVKHVDFWWFLEVLHCFLVIVDGSWWFLIFLGGFWCSWGFCGGLCFFVVICYNWLFYVVPGCFWWLLFVLFGLSAIFGNICHLLKSLKIPESDLYYCKWIKITVNG